MINEKSTILIIDDSEIVRDVMANKMASLGYTSLCAASAAEALRLKEKHVIDLFIIDINMPDIDGIEFLKMLDIPNNSYTAIMLTAIKDFKCAKHSMELGAFSYIGKPYDYLDLENQIAKALQLVKLRREREEYYRNLEHEVERKSDELKQYIEILENREKRLDTIINSIGEGLFALDNDDNIMLVNAEFERIANQELHKFIGEHIEVAIEDKSLLYQLRNIISKKNSEEKSQDGIISLFMSDKNLHYFSTNVSIIKGGDQQTIGHIITLSDQSDKIRTEQLRRSFLNNVSHELRTPTTAIISMTEALRNSNVDDEQKEYLQIMDECENSLLDLLNEILDYSRIERGIFTISLDEFCLGTLCERVINILSARAKEKELVFSYNIAEKIYRKVKIDGSRFQQILMNILGNAIKFTLKGEVELSANCLSESADQIKVLISIRDTGIGIPHNKLSLIFEEFTQVEGASNRKFGGTGLGLAISKKLVDLMGGKIWVESEVNNGSTFYILITFKFAEDQQTKNQDKTEMTETR